MNLAEKLNTLFNNQTQSWDKARENYAGLQNVMVKTIPFSGHEMLVQFNAKRIISSSASIDPKSISERPCFLCSQNRPAQQQGLPYEKDYILLVNPYPVFKRHLTIPSVQHLPQQITGNFNIMLKLARDLPQFTMIYNGPKCGASAPDHFHFQAIEQGVLPIESDFSVKRKVRHEGNLNGVMVYSWENYQRKSITLESNDINGLESLFNLLYSLLETYSSSAEEPMMNILTQYDFTRWVVHIFPRLLHRPRQFFEQGEKQILFSPASIDMGGVLIMPRKADFDKITRHDIEDIFRQVCVDESTIRELLIKLSNSE